MMRWSIAEILPARFKHWARAVRRDAHALYLSSRDPRVPWYAKVLAVAVAAYAFSPIDLIPDFVPVLGYVDDLIILPLAIILVVKLIPPQVMAEHRATAMAAESRSAGRVAAVIVIVIWLLGAAWCVGLMFGFP